MTLFGSKIKIFYTFSISILNYFILIKHRWVKFILLSITCYLSASMLLLLSKTPLFSCVNSLLKWLKHVFPFMRNIIFLEWPKLFTSLSLYLCLSNHFIYLHLEMQTPSFIYSLTDFSTSTWRLLAFISCSTAART